MSYAHLAYAHLATVLPALFIGAFIFLKRKGTPLHKLFGKIYLTLMLITGLITLTMSAEIGTRLFNHLGFIHIFSLVTLYCVPAAYFAALRGDIRTHQYNMIGLYAGGLLIAGSFALMPGRMLHNWLF